LRQSHYHYFSCCNTIKIKGSEIGNTPGLLQS
jgi:hypothetical protein